MVKKALNMLGLGVVVSSGRLLKNSDRRKIYLVAGLQVSLSILDLIGVAVIGLLGAISVSGIQSQQPGSRIAKFLEFVSLENASVQTQVTILGITATLILISRTVLSIFITRRYIFFLSRKGSEITKDLLGKILGAPLLKIQETSTQKTIFGLTESIKAVTLGVLATSVSLFSDLALMAILAIGLFVVDATIALSTVILFGAVGLILHKSMTTKSQSIGRAVSSDSVELNEEFSEVLHSYRESLVFGTREGYYKRIATLRDRLAINQAEIQFMPSISKYVIELSLIIGALVISAIQFSMKDAVHAVATLSVFMAAGSRIGPAVMRVQQGIIQIRSAIGVSETGLQLIDSFRQEENLYASDKEKPSKVEQETFQSSVDVARVSFRYPGSQRKVLNDLSFNVIQGTFLAIAGSSGAGKTTLVDLILGVIPPTEGQICISSLNSRDAISRWPGMISYVPQEVYISNSSIRRNVALGLNDEEIVDSRVQNALRKAQLEEFAADSASGLGLEVGERGSKLSGGQRQRLGIARALYTDPKLLVLDEATSALDGETEAEITSTLLGLKGEITLIVIAHRLSTIKEADHVIYLHDGEILSQGTFAEVSAKVQAFGINQTV
jgi:ABC-type multidrug transport system fused ATPase/permease subunit